VLHSRHWKVQPSADPVDGATLLNNVRQVFPPLHWFVETHRHRLAAMGAACVDVDAGDTAYRIGLADDTDVAIGCVHFGVPIRLVKFGRPDWLRGRYVVSASIAPELLGLA
jgi:hypothetical protein